MLGLGHVTILAATSRARACQSLVQLPEAIPSGRPWNVASALWDTSGSINWCLCSYLHWWVWAKIIRTVMLHELLKAPSNSLACTNYSLGFLPIDAIYITKC